MDYQHIDLGIRLGNRFLTSETAYLLGLILAANEKIHVAGQIYWVAPVRHNSSHISPELLEQHFESIRKISVRLNLDSMTQMSELFKRQEITIPKFNPRMVGFATLIPQEVDSLTFNDLIRSTRESLLISDRDTVIRSFLVGIFDGRGSADQTYVSIDLTEEPDLINLIREVWAMFSSEKTNYNKSERFRQDGSKRENQFRLKRLVFLQKIGFISPQRFKKATAYVKEQYIVREENVILPNLKTIYLNLIV